MPRKAKTAKEYENELFYKEIDYFPVNLDDYVNTHTKIEHECLKGHIWSAEPANILRGRGCPICYGRSTKLKSGDQYILDLKVKNPNFIVKNKKEYINSKGNLTHVCSKGHEILLSPNQALQGYGCSSCNRRGIYNTNYFKKYPKAITKPATIYLIALTIQGNQALKIGITINFETRIKYYKRFSPIIIVNKALPLEQAFKTEQYLLNKYQIHRVKSAVVFDGHSELLNTNIEGSLIKELEIL